MSWVSSCALFLNRPKRRRVRVFSSAAAVVFPFFFVSDCENNCSISRLYRGVRNIYIHEKIRIIVVIFAAAGYCYTLITSYLFVYYRFFLFSTALSPGQKPRDLRHACPSSRCISYAKPFEIPASHLCSSSQSPSSIPGAGRGEKCRPERARTEINGVLK